jgi:hypothetical protein
MRMGAQQACIIIGTIGTKSLIQIARAIQIGWTDLYRRPEAHHGVRAVHNGHERYHGPDEHLSRMFHETCGMSISLGGKTLAIL